MTMEARCADGVVAINHAQRGRVDAALFRARSSAYGPDEFVGQESFMRASDVLRLAAHADIGPQTSILDLCCGVGGPGLLIARTLGCRYLGVDASPSAVALARDRAVGVSCRFEVAQVPPLPAGRHDVALLLETMLAFPDKRPLVTCVADALQPGGRFAFTLEEGMPLSDAERRGMPDADTVWLTPLCAMFSTLSEAGLHVTWRVECTDSHLEVAQRLHDELVGDATRISEQIGAAALEALLAAHRQWIGWFRRGRARKFMFVAQKSDAVCREAVDIDGGAF